MLIQSLSLSLSLLILLYFYHFDIEVSILILGQLGRSQVPKFQPTLQAWSWKEMGRIHVSPNIHFYLVSPILSWGLKGGFYPSYFMRISLISYPALFWAKGVFFSCFPWGSNGTTALWEHDSCGRRWKQINNILKYYSHYQTHSSIAERDLLDLGGLTSPLCTFQL